MRKNITVWIRALAIAIVVVPLVSLASDLTIPNSFTAGTVIQSAQVNANFAAVQTAVNTKQDAVTGSCDAGSTISAINADGTVTCAAAGLTYGDTATGDSSSSGITVGNSGTGAGIEGDNTYGGPYGGFTQITEAGVKGACTNTSNLDCFGVWGDSVGSGTGVYGSATSGDGVQGNSNAGPGVSGITSSATAAGVEGINLAGGPGLSLKAGTFQVLGAGVGTTTAAFTVVASTATINGTDVRIDNTATNNNPNLLLFVTPTLWAAGTSYTANASPVAAAYNSTTGGWFIRNLNGTAMTNNAAFNVWVVSP